MKVVGFAGWSGSGKTTLVERLIPGLVGRGLRVAVLKHAHHDFDIDQPGKDSRRHREAGACEVLVASQRRLALIREFGPAPEPGVHALLAMLDPGVDWVLVEGYKDSDLPKIEVWRPSTGQSPRCPQDARILAVATDAGALPAAAGRCAALDLNRPDAVLAWLLDNAQRFDYPPSANRA